VSAGKAARSGLRALLGAIPDPELPMVSIADLGILRDVRVEGTHVEVDITPTYSGCPALDAIRDEVRSLLRERGWDDVRVHTVLAPPWTSEWVSEAGRRTLREHGIAPPSKMRPAAALTPLPIAAQVTCPCCGAGDPELLSAFSSTACKALLRCRSCGEPFERFKDH
jgi:ring-1,2-phenylacetyl-CoA epoxidase subunit PaaD